MIIGKAIMAGGASHDIAAILSVVYPTGATCTVSGNGKTLAAPDTSGTVTFELPAAGSWTVTAVQGSDTAAQALTVTAGDVYEVALSFGTPLSALLVGDSVYMNVNNARKEFLVIHQGKPSSIYSTTFDNGTILLMKDIYENQKWHSSRSNNYANSTLHSYLNNGFLALFDMSVQSIIKQVKVPYRAGSGDSKTVTSGENGLSTKIFLLSGAEVGFTSSDSEYLPTSEGAKLDYFESGEGTSANNKRVAKLNGTAIYWWNRSPYCTSASNIAFDVSQEGRVGGHYSNESHGVRPALVLPNTILVDDQHNII